MELKILTDEQRRKVIIPCEKKCKRKMPDVTTDSCMDCIVDKFCQAQLDQDKAELEAIEDKIYETVENNYVENIIPKLIEQEHLKLNIIFNKELDVINKKNQQKS